MENTQYENNSQQSNETLSHKIGNIIIDSHRYVINVILIFVITKIIDFEFGGVFDPTVFKTCIVIILSIAIYYIVINNLYALINN